MKVLITGHRPKLLGGYHRDIYDRVLKTAKKSIELLETPPDLVLLGMALGWDLAIAQVCKDLEIRYIGYVPNYKQSSIWPEPMQRLYTTLYNSAHAIVVLNSDDNYDKRFFFLRNKMMVDELCNDDVVLTLYDGISVGGTGHCLKLAMKKKLKILNAWGIFKNTSEHLIEIDY